MEGTLPERQLTPGFCSEKEAQTWKGPLTPPLSPSEGERVPKAGEGAGCESEASEVRGQPEEIADSRSRARLRSGGIQFRVATTEDDAAIRRLLRDNPMPGEIALSFERESDFFLGTKAGDVDGDAD